MFHSVLSTVVAREWNSLYRLAPVLLLAVYYLLDMGWIVDRIVSVDAPAATLAQQFARSRTVCSLRVRGHHRTQPPATAQGAIECNDVRCDSSLAFDS